MPAIYAHHQFGEQVYAALDKSLQELIAPHKTAFQIGLQGPDVFFFYHPWKKNDLVAFGNGLHDKSARELFAQGLLLDRNSASYAYMMGVACHYALDSTCHPYVNQYEAETNILHIEIESEFEKMLLRREEKDPFTYRMDLLIPTDKQTAEAIYLFYRMFDVERIETALCWMQRFRKLFTEPCAIRQGIMNGILDLFGFGKFKGQILQLKDNPHCAKSNAMLYQLWESAIPHAVSMLHELDLCKQNGTLLGERWDKTFA